MKTFNIILLVIAIALMIVVSHWLGQQAYSWLPIPATIEAEAIGDLFSFLVTLGALVFFGVMGFLFYSIIFYRAAKGDDTDGPAIRGNAKLEIIWTVIPIILVTWIAGYSYGIYQRMDLVGSLPIVQLNSPLAAAYAQNSPLEVQPEEKIEVIAKQWSWLFRYPSHNRTSSELHLPVNHRIHLIMRSEDVIHGFYVPNFHLKQDIIPNQTIDFSFTPNRLGKYKLHDSQFSGTYFALMEADVYVDSPEDYQKWLAQITTKDTIPAENKAKSEHLQPPLTLLRSSWHTVEPADPPLVNQQR